MNERAVVLQIGSQGVYALHNRDRLHFVGLATTVCPLFRTSSACGGCRTLFIARCSALL